MNMAFTFTFLIAAMQADALRMEAKEKEGVFRCSASSAVQDMAALDKHMPQGYKEAGTNVQEYKWEMALVNEVQAKRICQTGFNTGTSALAFLCAANDTIVHSYDLGEHAYASTQSDFLTEMFPGRHELVLGDSTKTLQRAIEQLAQLRGEASYITPGAVPADTLCDLAFVDGGHTYDIALADITNFRRLTKPGGRLLVENCNADNVERALGGVGAVNKAYLEALNQGIAIHEGQVSMGCGTHPQLQFWYCREICVARFA
jgi:hypothetical protein